MADWQPIETAPRDGTRVLIFDPGYGVTFAEYEKASAGGGVWWYPNVAIGDECEPTHWFPLPEPPVAGKTGNGSTNKPSPPDGEWVLVPREPDLHQKLAGEKALSESPLAKTDFMRSGIAYRAMISSAPSAPTEGVA